MWFTKTRKKKKMLEHGAYMLRYALRMKEDLLPPETRARLQACQTEVKQALKTRGYDVAEALTEKAVGLANEVNPAPMNLYSLRENVEVFAVVFAVALGFRTYFLQPYQIPTGSMQPTLYGITAVADYEPDWTDSFPANIGKFLLSGASYKEIRAKEDGVFRHNVRQEDTFLRFSIGNRSYKVHQEMHFLKRPGDQVRKGQLIARGLQKRGDHILVDRISFNFRKPRRGEIVVFSTRGLPIVRANSAYIKRLVGLPGERIQIQDSKLVVDGKVVREPAPFERLYTQTSKGYDGYHLDANSKFTSEDSFLQLGEQEYLFFGDNTARSLDGRFFGGAPGKNIIGPAFFVPWPFVNRGIWGESAGSVQ